MGEGEWEHSKFGCLNDIGTCVITWFLPCLTFGQNADNADVTSCIVGSIIFFVPFLNIYCLAKTRGAVRDKYGIDGSFIGDLICVVCCTFCTLIQEAQQLKEPGQGIDRD